MGFGGASGQIYLNFGLAQGFLGDKFGLFGFLYGNLLGLYRFAKLLRKVDGGQRDVIDRQVVGSEARSQPRINLCLHLVALGNDLLCGVVGHHRFDHLFDRWVNNRSHHGSLVANLPKYPIGPFGQDVPVEGHIAEYILQIL